MLMRIALLALVAIVGVALYIRFAPDDPARWHVDPANPANWTPNVAVFCPDPGGRFSVTGDLAALDAVAMASPRTTRLAGSVNTGRITWVTRSRLFGFPDYTTAAVREVDGQEGLLCVVARQRFGLKDGGVNAARLQGWLQTAYGFLEAPSLGRPAS